MKTANPELSEREVGVLRLVARGLSNGKIGARLGLAETTVKTHVRRILKKLGVSDRTHAVALGYETGLLASPAVAAIRAARPLLLGIPQCRRHPVAAPLPVQCPECARWTAARQVVADLDAALAGVAPAGRATPVPVRPPAPSRAANPDSNPRSSP